MSKFSILRTQLEKNGWSIASLELPSDCWWAKEIWALTSTWTPTGKTIYLTLLIDPSFDGDPNNIPENDVWSIGLSSTFPNKRLLENTHEVSVKNSFSLSIDNVLRISADLRNAD